MRARRIISPSGSRPPPAEVFLTPPPRPARPPPLSRARLLCNPKLLRVVRTTHHRAAGHLDEGQPPAPPSAPICYAAKRGASFSPWSPHRATGHRSQGGAPTASSGGRFPDVVID